MTDRELMELAAKAYWGDEIGDTCDVEWSEADQAILYLHGDNQDHNGIDRWLVWNPLEDDGDALRLAVRRLPRIDWVRALGRFDGHVSAVYQDEAAMRSGVIEAFKGDSVAATRRAIVRAAAAIGSGASGDLP